MPLSCLTDREIGRIIGTSEELMKIQLRSAFDKLGVWSRLELAMYLASTAARAGRPSPACPPSGSHLRRRQGWGFFGKETFLAQTLETKPMS